MLMPESCEDIEDRRSSVFAMAPVYGKAGLGIGSCEGGPIEATTVREGLGNDSDRCLSMSADLGR